MLSGLFVTLGSPCRRQWPAFSGALIPFGVASKAPTTRRIPFFSRAEGVRLVGRRRPGGHRIRSMLLSVDVLAGFLSRRPRPSGNLPVLGLVR